MNDAINGPNTVLTTAVTGSTTSTARLYMNGGSPIKGQYANFLFNNISLLTAGTLGMTFQPRVLCSADGTAYRVLAQGAPITAGTVAISTRPVSVPFVLPAAEPYAKVEIFGSTATGAVTPVATFYCWWDTAAAAPVP